MQPPKIKRILDNNIIKNIDTTVKTPSPERKNEIYKEPLKNNVHTIQGVSIDDIDGAVISKIKEVFETTQGDEVSIYDFSKDRFNEIVQSWNNKSPNDSFNLPFINISKESTPKKGTNMNGVSYNVPNNLPYNLIKVPIQDASGLTYYEHYQVPQPVNIDINYEITVLSNTLSEINRFDEKMIGAFRFSQLYVKVNNSHYMPMHYDNDADEKNEENIDKRRYYKHVYKILLKGYIIPQDEIIMIKSAKKLNMSVNIQKDETECVATTNKFKESDTECLLSLNFLFKRRGSDEQKTILKNNLNIYDENQENSGTYRLFINGVEKFVPFNAFIGDELTVKNISGYDKNFLLKLYAEQI